MQKIITDPIIISKSTKDSKSLIMPHQQEAVDALTKYYKTDEDIEGRNGVVVMPTGSGKTYTAVTWLLENCVAKGYKVVWLVHRQELVEQTYQEFIKQAPLLKGSTIQKLKVYPISGEHLHMSVASGADIYVCSIASAANRNGYRFIRRMLGAKGMRRLAIVVDEAHHATAGNYQKAINRMTELNPNRILLGLTATPYRMQKSEQRQFQKMFNIDENLKKHKGTRGYVYEVTLKQLMTSGFLAEPKYIPVETQIVGEVEYDISEEDKQFFLDNRELSERLKMQIAKSSARNQAILDEYLKHKAEYGKTLIFAVNQMHAETLCKEFIKAGINCDFAISDRKDAQDVIKNFKNNDFDVLVNVQIMTEGSDVPDIKTVFLTRETNSDSLLMQMIGRSLRGERAGGTKTANIVAFHDEWDRFMHWMDPGELEIFADPDDPVEVAESEPDEDVPVLGTNEEVLEDMLKFWLDSINRGDDEESQSEVTTTDEPDQKVVSSRDLYLKLYELMRASLRTENKTPIFPCGWYSVIDQDGSEKQVLVFEQQLRAYRFVAADIDNIKGIDIDSFLKRYFKGVEPLPLVDEVEAMIEYIEASGTMPLYYTFEGVRALDPSALAKDLKERFEKNEDREMFLKELFEKSPILQNIYRYFFAFRKTIFDAMKEHKDGTTTTQDERDTYEIIENYYDLNELFSELKTMYPQLRFDMVSKVAWSDNIVKQWFALCQSFLYENKLYFQLTVNKLFASPLIDKEVIKYLMFHELLHANGWWNHNRDFRDREWQYPNSEELDGIIDSLLLNYKVEKVSGTVVSDEIPEIDYDAITSLNGLNGLSSKPETEPEYNREAKGVEPGYKYCRNCGNKLPDTAKFCDKCGERIDY